MNHNFATKNIFYCKENLRSFFKYFKKFLSFILNIFYKKMEIINLPKIYVKLYD